jgi:hypothetical protein
MLLQCGSLFIAYWRSNPDETQSRLTEQIMLRRSSGGWAGIYWQGVTLVQQPAGLPFLEKRLYSVRIGETEDCDEGSVQVVPDRLAREIRVQCGRQNPVLMAHVKIP